jgi:SAM-dependent methyltransferase
VTGARLLHLQCAFGADTISWSRLGAQATGIDFAVEAVQVARRIASALREPTRFSCVEIEDLAESEPEHFNIVYASRGVVRWLPDLNKWFTHVARLLAPGGFLYLSDTHPILKTLQGDAPTPIPSQPYFATGHPARVAVPRAGRSGQRAKYLWTHDLGEIVTAAAQAGLTVKYLREQPWTERRLPFLRAEESTRRWVMKNGNLPLHFTLRADKPS